MAQAEDLAVEDCLLVLEKALLTSKLTPEAYMTQVRVGGGGWGDKKGRSFVLLKDLEVVSVSFASGVGDGAPVTGVLQTPVWDPQLREALLLHRVPSRLVMLC
jgi:hypothetical protein